MKTERILLPLGLAALLALPLGLRADAWAWSAVA